MGLISKPVWNRPGRTVCASRGCLMAMSLNWLEEQGENNSRRFGHAVIRAGFFPLVPLESTWDGFPNGIN